MAGVTNVTLDRLPLDNRRQRRCPAMTPRAVRANAGATREVIADYALTWATTHAVAEAAK